MKIADLKLILCNVNFKKEITKCFTLYLCGHSSDILYSDQTVVISGGLDKVVSVSIKCVHHISNQEEADIR